MSFPNEDNQLLRLAAAGRAPLALPSSASLERRGIVARTPPKGATESHTIALGL